MIAGAAKGHKLQTVDGLNTRPTTDRIKETLFNIIAFSLPECRFLDLFSGSGAIGIEALSRGAKEAVFVEEATACHAVILKNLEHTKLIERARVMKSDVMTALDKLSEEGLTFDIIFMDPPYAAGLAEPALKAIAAGGLLKADGVVIVERSAKMPFVPVSGYYIDREKEYKTTVMTFLRPEESAT